MHGEPCRGETACVGCCSDQTYQIDFVQATGIQSAIRRRLAYYSLEDARQAKINRTRNAAAMVVTRFMRRFFGKNLLLPLVQLSHELEIWYGEPMIPRQFERKWFLAEWVLYIFPVPFCLQANM